MGLVQDDKPVLSINKKIFDRVFPFSFVLNTDLEVIVSGKGLQKLVPDPEGKTLFNLFTIKRPTPELSSVNDLIDFSDQIFILSSKSGEKKFLLRGEFLPVENGNVVFLGSPWLSNPDQLAELNLTLTDFALHDSVTDMLHVVKMKDIVARDIKMLNAQLEEKEKRYRELVEQGSDIIYKVNFDGKIIYLNEVASKKMGYTKQEILGTHILDYVLPDWKESIESVFKRLKDPDSEKESYFEFPVRAKNKSIIWFGQNVQVLYMTDEAEEPEIRAFAKDITSRKEVQLNLESTELRLGNLIRNLNSGILVEDETRHIVLANQTFCDLFQIPVDPEQLIGMDCSKSVEDSKDLFVDPDDFVKVVADTLLLKRRVLGAQLLMKNGTYLERDYIPIYSGTRYVGHLWNYRDLSKEKKNLEDLIKARRDAEKAKESEKQFLTHMSHEMRTPLNAISGMSYLLKGSNLDKEQEEFLRIQESSIKILGALINDVLDLARIEEGKLNINNSELNLHHLLRNILSTFKLQLKHQAVDISLELPSGEDLYIISDELLINQVWYNLIGNAVKFTREGSISLALEILTETDTEIGLKFSVKDTGIGLRQDQLEVIFERFKQADEEISVQYGGTGLGLAITSRIVKALGGEIQVESREGEGSNFYFNLNFLKAPKKKVTAAREIADQSTALESLHCLVAEDNAMNTFYLRRVLAQLKIKADFCVNGEEAVQLSQQKKYHLILMDIRMPVKDGIEASEEIRTSAGPNENTPIIALTASAFEEDKKRAKQAGINEHLSKPFSPNELKSAINHCLANKRDFRIEEEPFDEEGTIDRQALTDLYENDLDSVRAMLDIFISENYPILKEIRSAIEEEKYSLGRELSHKIKPSFKMIGLTEAESIATELEDSCRSDHSSASEKIAKLIELTDSYLPKIKAYLN